MALVVETGAGVAGANTYHDLVSAAAYFAERPNAAAWSGSTDPLRTEALLYSCAWLEGRYGGGLRGGIVASDQALLWPRGTFYDSHGRLVATGTVPEAWKNAQAEAALAHLAARLNEVRDRGGAIESVAAGSVEVVWAQGAPAGRTFPFVDDSLIQHLLEFGGGQRRLVRAGAG